MRQGEGSLFPRRDPAGRTVGWTAQISIGDRQHRRRVSRVRRTYAEARDALRELRDEARAGLNPSKLSLSRYLARWIADVRNLRPSTQRAYIAAIEYHISPALGEIVLRDLTPLHVERFLADLATRLAPKSQRNVHAVLRRALNSAVRSGLLPRNVASRQFVDAPRVPRAEPRALTASEVGRLLEQLRGEVIEPIVIIALATGLRQGEVLGLVWEDLELDARRLRIRRELVRRAGRYYRDELKTPRARRTVPLPPPAVEALMAQRSRVIEAGFVPTATGAVFPARRGGPLNGSWVTKRLQAAMLRAGIGRGDFRMLRRTFASRLFAAGIPDRYIADLMGHTATTVTHGHYISTGSDAQNALKVLEEMLA
jgi:integrase